MVAREFGVTVAEHFINRARHFTALDMRRTDVVGRTDKRTSERFDPIAVDDDEVGFVLHTEVRKPDHGFRKDHILRIARPLVQELVHLNAWDTMNLDLRHAVLFEHMHARHKKRHIKARVAARNRKWL